MPLLALLAVDLPADLLNGIEVFTIGEPMPMARITNPGFGRYGRPASLSDDNRLLAAPLGTGEVRVWNLAAGAAVATSPPLVGVQLAAGGVTGRRP